ncbi:long-chain-fatty-acid--CoA ligase [Ammoniphilus resinae]|uniref:Long-chain acyl-CoA synthetase n=1 Tax=Ammoniphilus resinae TaxID=861532 RepID=A0ABS4GJZ5_9BACL|nr:long-chain fatty acid--CoA ligase [Ammoniphilus resinae]MBP1930593.1 long-chain acyl-CoA synthetase [Ammoniphilus resinae]
MDAIHLGNFYLKNSSPSDFALIYHDQKITYKKLDENINQYAHYLTSLGIGKGDSVALSCYNTPEFIYSYLAITKIGAMVVPLNLMLTLDELQYILMNAETKAIIIHPKIVEKLQLNPDSLKEGLGIEEIIILDDTVKQKIMQSAQTNLPQLDPSSTSTLLYTSGTTGKPKGAMLSHRNLLENAKSCEFALEGTGSDVFLCVLPMFHTFGFTVCVLLPLYVGNTIVIHDSFHPKEVLESIQKYKITVFAGIPAMYIVLSQAMKASPQPVHSLRAAVSGGAPLPLEIFKLFNEDYQIPLIEGYGLTEASPVVSFNPLSGVKKGGSVGLPLLHNEVKVVDPGGNEVATGEIGEILVKGPNVMQGYYKAEEETASTIVNGWLHTGDLGYIDHEGYLFIVDRKKELIITRGLNVYPREIEEVLYAHPSILEAAVIGAPDPTKGEIVKAFVVLKPGEQLERKELSIYLQKHLANYKLPRQIEFVEQLPKNAAGKILKKQLK